MLWQIISLIVILIVIPIAVFITLKFKKDIQKVPVTANMPIVENDFRKQFTNGYTLGVLKSMILCKNRCYRVEFYPMDVEQGEDVQRPTIQTVIVREAYIKPFSRGELSDRRERIKLITRDPFLIPEKLRDETEGQWITKEGQKAWVISTIQKAIPSGDEVISEFMNKWTRTGIAKETFAQYQEADKLIKKRELEQPDLSKKEKE